MKDWHQPYRERYAKLKEAGRPFFPNTVFKDALAALLIFAALAILAWKVGAGLEGLADPTDTTYNPRPEWYFLFLFQALKAFPGSLEPVAAVLLPGAAVMFLMALPLIDRGSERHPLDRPLLTGLGVLALLVVGSLTVAGLRSPLVNPVEEKDPRVLAGRRIYQDMDCAYCHKIKGKGGAVGPELDKVAGGRSVEWLEAHFRDPKSMTPGSKMPQLHLLDDEISALTAYMKSLDGEPFTAEAPKLFAGNCASCHKIGQEGGDVGPDLSRIGSARDKAFIKRYIADPTASKPDTIMPAFKGQLTDVQIEDLARYLASLGR
jgi:ubiquinol-cytochrome c reductase cytochrome b subunit